MPARTSLTSQLAWKRQHGCSYSGNQAGSAWLGVGVGLGVGLGAGSASKAVIVKEAPSGYSSRKGRIELEGELAPRSR
eukprot:scaffold26117_cov56-Phaeocystis_antarctica.AAC.1